MRVFEFLGLFGFIGILIVYYPENKKERELMWHEIIVDLDKVQGLDISP